MRYQLYSIAAYVTRKERRISHSVAILPHPAEDPDVAFPLPWGAFSLDERSAELLAKCFGMPLAARERGEYRDHLAYLFASVGEWMLDVFTEEYEVWYETTFLSN